MKNNSGFTLMELMTVIAIIGIMSAVAVPNMIAWRANHQLTGSAREVMAVINGARLSAIKNNAMVTVTFDAGAREVTAAYTNRATGVVHPTATPLKIGVDISAASFSGSPSFRFNSRGLPMQMGSTAPAFGAATLSNSSGATLDVAMARTGSACITK